MAISVADNFSYKGAKPLDARFQFSSVANMKSATASDLYDGCLAYVTATKKYYTYDSTNTSTEETGKWKELETGGGGGSTYTAGDGIVIDNDEISVDEMPTADMSDVIYPLPSSSGGGGGGQTIQVDTLPAPSAQEEGNIYQYVGDAPISKNYMTDATLNFVGDGNRENNRTIYSNYVTLQARDAGQGIIKCNKPLKNKGTLKITRTESTGAISSCGVQLGTTMGSSDIYSGLNWGNQGAKTVTQEIDLSQYDSNSIYVTFVINVASGNSQQFTISSMVHEVSAESPKGVFYECKSTYEGSTLVYYWDAVLPALEATTDDIPEITTPLPSVMSRRFKYSTTEQVFGEWIDGSPIYQKTIDTGTMLSASGTRSVNHGISNFGKLIWAEGYMKATSGAQRPLPAINTGSDFVCIQTVSNTQITFVQQSGWSNWTESYVTLYYTKSAQ